MKWVVAALAIVMGPLLLIAPVIGLLAQPWSPWYVSGGAMQPPVLIGDGPQPIGDPGNLAPTAGMVTDAQRHQLARQAGWSPSDAITATAISIAENSSGNPAAISGRNTNGTFDLGLWQINSAHWPQFGGQQALIDPWRNAQAAFAIFGRQGWCAWSTYEASCGSGHGSQYRAFLARAAAASKAQPDPRQA
jgi:hypothetical protein